MKYQKALLGIVIAISAVGILVYLLITHKQPISQRQLRLKKVRAQWESLPFESIQEGQKLLRLIQDTEIAGEDILDDSDRESLRQAVYNLLTAYHQGGFEAFCRFRIPMNSHPVLSTPGVTILASFARAQSNQSLIDNAHWKPLYEKYVEHSSNKSFYSNFWIGVCFDRNTLLTNLGPPKFELQYGVSVHQSQTIDSFFVVHQDEVAQEASTNRETWHFNFKKRLVSFDESAVNVLRRDGRIIFGDLHCWIERESPFATVPIFVRWYFDKRGAGWLPMEFAEGFVEKLPQYRPLGTNNIVTIF
jgi:hypothetical protein